MSQTNITTTKIMSTKKHSKKLANDNKIVYTGKKLKSWKRDNAKREPVEIY